MNGSAFFDTNVLVYSHDGSSPRKQSRAQELVKRGLRERTMVVSLQVLSELFVVETRRLGLDPVDTLRELHLLSLARVVEPTLAMVFESIAVAQSAQISYWGALIAVSAASAGCRIIYTEDLNHGQTVAGVLVVNPFIEGAV